MPLPKTARTGILLFITLGPFLVFVFLYVFGKNKYELDSYGLKVSSFPKEEVKSGAPIILFSQIETTSDRRDFLNEVNRLDVFFKKSEFQPRILQLSDSGLVPKTKLPIGLVQNNLIPDFWLNSDTVLSINTAKGKSTKRLPKPPRAFLFDTLHNLRGVYGLCNSQSMDTLMLEFKILTEK
jgi:hypothetical protein